jgi:hypothetical protein
MKKDSKRRREEVYAGNRDVEHSIENPTQEGRAYSLLQRTQYECFEAAPLRDQRRIIHSWAWERPSLLNIANIMAKLAIVAFLIVGLISFHYLLKNKTRLFIAREVDMIVKHALSIASKNTTEITDTAV